MKLTRLKWDTDFFNFNVAKIEGRINNQANLEKLEQKIQKNDVALAYYSSSEAAPSFVDESSKLLFKLVDRKVIFQKQIEPNSKAPNEAISPFDAKLSTENLERLAIQSGVYSRFNVDKKIKKEKFEEMYRLWLQNSINKKIAKEVFVYQEEGEIAGFVTLGEKSKLAEIGIIAVDFQFRGKGIGKALMQAAESWALQNAYQGLQVVTQAENLAACKLYESCGYSLTSTVFFYHVWRKITT